MKRAALMAIISLAASATAAADLQPKNTRITTFYPPDGSCGAFLKSEREGRSANQTWLAGYLTAFNQFGGADGDVSAGTDWDGMVEWLVQRCEEDPTESFINRAFQLMSHLEER